MIFVALIKDLIHGAPINKPVSNTASVKAVYRENDGSEISFTRRYVTEIILCPMWCNNCLKETKRILQVLT